MNRSALFSNFNQARAMARQGVLEMGRVNRALGLAQSKTPIRYDATGLHCNCPDATIRGAVCKHRIAAALIEG